MAISDAVAQGKRPGRDRAAQGGTQTQQTADAVIKTVSPGAARTKAVQTVTTDGTGGTFTLTYDSNESGNIAFDADIATMETAIEAITGITAVTVTGEAGAWVVQFDDVGITDADLFVADDTLLTGETTGTVVTETTEYVAAVGKIEAIWTNGESGTFTVDYDGDESAGLAPSIVAADLKTAIEGLTGVTTVAVTGTGSKEDPWLVAWTTPEGVSQAADLVLDASSLVTAYPVAARVS